MRISIQTVGLVFGGTGLCTYRVGGVDGGCAEHLTVESYTLFICQQSYLLLLGIPSPTHSYSRLKTFLFCKSFLPQHFLFLLQDSLHGFPRLFTVISEHICFLLLVFRFLHFLVVGSMRSIKLTHVGFRAHVKIASRIVSYVLSSTRTRLLVQTNNSTNDL